MVMDKGPAELVNEVGRLRGLLGKIGSLGFDVELQARIRLHETVAMHSERSGGPAKRTRTV